MNCTTCDAPLAKDARFCIECGTPVTAADTTNLAPLRERAGPQCPSCQVRNPAEALFCVNCGYTLRGGSPTTGRPYAPAPPPEPLPLERPGRAHDPEPLPLERAARRADRRGRRHQSRGLHPRRSPSPAEGGMLGGLFLIGLAVLFATGTFFPGILVLVGVMGFLGSATAGQWRAGLIPLIFMTGLAALFATGTIFPGILVLLGLIAILSPLLVARPQQ